MPELDVDGAIFCFPDDWEASKFDEWSYFRSVMSRIVDPLGRASHGCDVVALHDGDLWLIEAKDYSHPGRSFRGGFEDVEREGRGDGPVVGTAPRPTPLRPAGRLAWWDGVSHAVTRPAREHVTQPARSSLNPRARLPE